MAKRRECGHVVIQSTELAMLGDYGHMVNQGGVFPTEVRRSWIWVKKYIYSKWEYDLIHNTVLFLKNKIDF